MEATEVTTPNKQRSETLNIVRYIVTAVGPRYATSMAEAQTAAYVDGRLRRAGLSVALEPFSTPPWTEGLLLTIAFLGIVAAALSGWLPFFAPLLSGIAFLLAISDAFIAPLPMLGAARESQHVIGVRGSDQPARWRVIVVTALDSAPAHTFLQAVRTSGIGRIIGFGSLFALNIGLLLTGNIWYWYLQAIPFAYLLLFAFACMMPPQQRPVDDVGSAGAIAALLTAADRLRTLRSVEYWSIGLGAAASNTRGLTSILQRYPFSPADTLFIVLDDLNFGQIAITPSRHIDTQRLPDRLFTSILETLGSDKSIQIEEARNGALPPAAAALEQRGYRVLCLSTPETKRPAGGKRTVTNDPNVLERAAQVVLHFIQRLDYPGAL